MNTVFSSFHVKAFTLLVCIFLFGINTAHAEPGFGDKVDAFCAGKPGFENPPVFGGLILENCAKCHNPADKGKDQTPAFQLYKDNKNGPYTALCEYISPPPPPPPPPTPMDPPPPQNDACDKDGDGYCPNQGDCSDDPTVDPMAAMIYPGAPEICGDGIDNNCNGFESLHDDLMMQDPNTCPAACMDLDGDKYSTSAGCGPMDCNDDPNNGGLNMNPGAPEMCSDGIDNNCNMLVDSADPTCLVMDDYAKLQELKASLKEHKKACKAKEKEIKKEIKALKKKIERAEEEAEEYDEDDDDDDDDEDDDEEDEEEDEDEDDD